jgi:hypothetical protein
MNFKPLLIPLIVGLIVFLVAGYFSLINVDVNHDGSMFKPALDVAEGRMLFRDTFTQYGAVTVLIQALALTIFGKFLIVIKLLTAVFYGLSASLIVVIGRRFLPIWLNLITVLIWLLLAPYYLETFLPWSSVYALFFQLLTAYLFSRYLESEQRKWIFITGMAASITFWCRQPVGGSLLIALFFLCLYLKLKSRKETLLYFFLGNLAIEAIMFIWLGMNQTLADWFTQSIVFAVAWAKVYHGTINSFFPMGPMPLTPLWTILPLAVMGVCVIARKKTPIIFSLAVISLASWVQYYPITEIRHVYWAATPMFLILSYGLLKYLPKPLILIGLLIITGYDIRLRVEAGIEKVQATYTTLNEPLLLKGMKVEPGMAKTLIQLAKDIRIYRKDHPETNLLTLQGEDPLLLTLDQNSPNFQPMYNDWTLQVDPSIYPNYVDKVKQYIAERQPLLIVYEEILLPRYCELKSYVLNQPNGTLSFYLSLPCP